MASIGLVNGTIEKGFVGQLKTLTIRASIEIRTNRSKSGDVQPDLICPLLSGPKLMIFWITKETRNAEQEASPGRDYRQAA